MAPAPSLSTHAVHTAPPLPPPDPFSNDDDDYGMMMEVKVIMMVMRRTPLPRAAPPLTAALLLLATKFDCHQVELPPSDKSCVELEGFKRVPRPRLYFQINTTQDILHTRRDNVTYKLPLTSVNSKIFQLLLLLDSTS